MKFIAFFAFVATVSATTIYPSADSSCRTVDHTSISRCGSTPLDYDIVQAKIRYDGHAVVWYQESTCSTSGGGDVAYVTKSEDCYKLPFKPRCVHIRC